MVGAINGRSSLARPLYGARYGTKEKLDSMNSPMPFFNPGQLYRRFDLHQEFGGQRRGGISTPAKAPFVMLITGDSGKRHGYVDEWTEEGLFLYTGEGQHGDMTFSKGNLAVRDHAENGKSLFLFEQDRDDKRYLRFIGELEYVRYLFREAPDTAGHARKAIVFELRPVGTLRPDSAAVSAALAGEVAPNRTSRGGGFGSVETNRKVERAAIDFVKREYEGNRWTVISVEADKVGYDLRCEKDDECQHIEVKGTQGQEVCFIITAAEIRNAMIDRHHVTCVVTSALAARPVMYVYSKHELTAKIELEPIAFRARLRSAQ